VKSSRHAPKSWVPTHTPLWHASLVHASPSTHDVPFGWNESAGHDADEPVQFSATSHCPAAARHVTEFGAKASAGQLGLEPLHDSDMSQTPAAERQTVPDGRTESAGHVELVPSQLSATSQTPAAARHCAPAFPAACWQATLDPLHRSVVQGLPSSAQAVPFGFTASAGQLTPTPSQLSA
jgi:hypothetical protein